MRVFMTPIMYCNEVDLVKSKVEKFSEELEAMWLKRLETLSEFALMRVEFALQMTGRKASMIIE